MQAALARAGWWLTRPPDSRSGGNLEGKGSAVVRSCGMPPADAMEAPKDPLSGHKPPYGITIIFIHQSVLSLEVTKSPYKGDGRDDNGNFPRAFQP